MDFTPALMILMFLWNVGLTIVGFARRPGDEAVKAAKESQQEMESLKGRVSVLETHFEHLPTSHEVAELKAAAREMRATQMALQESVDSVRKTVHLIDEHLRRISSAK